MARFSHEAVREINLKKIHPNSLNPRLEFNIERLNELAESIREVGLLEPIIVRPTQDGSFEVVVGERRYRASHQAGLDSLPAIVREYSDDEVVQLNLIENIHRDELSAIEKGKVCKYLLESCPEKYPSRAAIAARIGVSSDAISLWLRSSEVVPEEVQTLVAPSNVSGRMPDGKVDYLTAVEVSRSLEKPEKKIEVIKKLAEKHLPAREREEVIRRVAQQPDAAVDEIIKKVAEEPSDLEFPAEDKKPIMDGLKTQVSQLYAPDPKLKAGTEVFATIHQPRFAKLRIRSIERKRLRYFDSDDVKREGYKSMTEFQQSWRHAHGDWDEEQLVYVIHFEKLK